MIRFNLNISLGGVGRALYGGDGGGELGPRSCSVGTPREQTDRRTTENITFATSWRVVISKNISQHSNNSVVYIFQDNESIILHVTCSACGPIPPGTRSPVSGSRPI